MTKTASARAPASLVAPRRLRVALKARVTPAWEVVEAMPLALLVRAQPAARADGDDEDWLRPFAPRARGEQEEDAVAAQLARLLAG